MLLSTLVLARLLSACGEELMPVALPATIEPFADGTPALLGWESIKETPTGVFDWYGQTQTPVAMLTQGAMELTGTPTPQYLTQTPKNPNEATVEPTATFEPNPACLDNATPMPGQKAEVCYPGAEEGKKIYTNTGTADILPPDGQYNVIVTENVEIETGEHKDIYTYHPVGYVMDVNTGMPLETFDQLVHVVMDHGQEPDLTREERSGMALEQQRQRASQAPELLLDRGKLETLYGVISGNAGFTIQGRLRGAGEWEDEARLFVAENPIDGEGQTRVWLYVPCDDPKFPEGLWREVVWDRETFMEATARYDDGFRQVVSMLNQVMKMDEVVNNWKQLVMEVWQEGMLPDHGLYVDNVSSADYAVVIDERKLNAFASRFNVQASDLKAILSDEFWRAMTGNEEEIREQARILDPRFHSSIVTLYVRQVDDTYTWVKTAAYTWANTDQVIVEQITAEEMMWRHILEPFASQN